MARTGKDSKYSREKPPEGFDIRPQTKDRARKFAEAVAENITEPEMKEKVIEALVTPEKVLPARETHKSPMSVWTPETDAEMAYTQMVLYDLLTQYRKPRVKDDKELAERIDEYFTKCAREGKTPLVEELCLACGLSPTRFTHVISGAEKGFSPLTKEIFQRARDFMQAFDAKMVMANKVPFLAYCFRAKCYYGMREDMSCVLDGRDPDSTERLTPKQLKEKYLQGIQEVDFEDKTGENN